MAAVATTQEKLLERIVKVEALVDAYLDAIQVIITGGAQKSYKLDTGQGVITVERQDLVEMNATVNSLMNLQQILCQRAGLASGSVTVRGPW